MFPPNITVTTVAWLQVLYFSFALLLDIVPKYICVFMYGHV